MAEDPHPRPQARAARERPLGRFSAPLKGHVPRCRPGRGVNARPSRSTRFLSGPTRPPFRRGELRRGARGRSSRGELSSRSEGRPGPSGRVPAAVFGTGTTRSEERGRPGLSGRVPPWRCLERGRRGARSGADPGLQGASPRRCLERGRRGARSGADPGFQGASPRGVVWNGDVEERGAGPTRAFRARPQGVGAGRRRGGPMARAQDPAVRTRRWACSERHGFEARKGPSTAMGGNPTPARDPSPSPRGRARPDLRGPALSCSPGTRPPGRRARRSSEERSLRIPSPARSSTCCRRRSCCSCGRSWRGGSAATRRRGTCG